MVNEIPRQESYDKVKKLIKKCSDRMGLKFPAAEVELEKHSLNGREILAMIDEMAPLTNYCGQLEREIEELREDESHYLNGLLEAGENLREIQYILQKSKKNFHVWKLGKKVNETLKGIEKLLE